MSTQQKYDIIIVGAGAAGLSLATRIAETSELRNRRVLILDKEQKLGNDRTWCFWEHGEGRFDEIITQSWNNIYFHSKYLSRRLGLEPYYAYKMLRSSDFYDHTLASIESSSNVDFVIDSVVGVSAQEGIVICSNGSYQADIVFSSKLPEDLDFSSHIYTDQHFGGWFIEFDEDVFDNEAATFMDFRIEQNDEHRFCYVLPINRKKALVEAAIFSKNHQTKDGYDDIIKGYIEDYVSKARYSIHEKEYGVIPMTNYPFWKQNKGKIYHIGTAGGAVKPSSGYAFKRIQQHTERIIDCLKSNTSIENSYKIFRGRHLLYDSVMLHVLEEQKISGDKVFSDLFEKINVDVLLRFLDGDTNFIGDIQIMKAPRMWPFIKGMAKVISPLK